MNPHQDGHDEKKPRVHIDADGNIFLFSDTGSSSQQESAIKDSPRHPEEVWEVTEETVPNMRAESRPRKKMSYAAFHDALLGFRGSVFQATNTFLSEGTLQYKTSARDAHGALSQARVHTGKGLQRLWGFLTQPVWVLQKNAMPKEYSRMTLFTLDVVRFGGTFAAIFVALFISLNYQSFWNIVSPHLDPLERSNNIAATTSELDGALRDKLLRSPALATAGRQQGDLLSFLPDVGPPENRIIIPRLGLNIPLVTPSFQSLLEEDWEGVETDIQDALQHGVVHYPGTARPGQAGNFFVTGHSSYYPWASGAYKTIFARLHELEVGDEYWVYYGGDKHRYVVQGKKEVKPSNVSVLDQPINKRVSTLMTCTPVGTTLRRLILTSQEVDPHTGIALKVGENGAKPMPKVKLESLPI